MFFSNPAVKREVGDEHRQFQEKWEAQYFFVEHRGAPTCLICTEKVAVHKEYNLRRHYTTRHAEEYEKYQGDERVNQAASLKTCNKISLRKQSKRMMWMQAHYSVVRSMLRPF